MNRDWNTVEVLRHARHDWLNKIQLIKGNLSLNKYGRVNEIIDEIVAESKQQSKLSNLNIPQFASLLLTCNWENHLFQIEFDVLDDHPNKNKIQDEALTNWTNNFFQTLDLSVKMFYDNYLSVTIEPQIEGTGFFFDFRGIITSREQIEQFLKREQSLKLGVTVQQFTEGELSLEFFLPNE
ncbi:Spo0B C-terminal domain-containing protein [Bacillus massilinigeriensis]|uniref:Spo0B C-terminal domain-containing protein n=1 Tax=Bacillus massilionigeriensis TaxID=1805475 RepID=UPI00096B0A65|nr:Spo0B C-terminal domain-containing protein [Bacillus massilionigeriensis]